jgi:hypothetical protein
MDDDAALFLKARIEQEHDAPLPPKTAATYSAAITAYETAHDKDPKGAAAALALATIRYLAARQVDIDRQWGLPEFDWPPRT